MGCSYKLVFKIRLLRLLFRETPGQQHLTIRELIRNAMSKTMLWGKAEWIGSNQSPGDSTV